MKLVDGSISIAELTEMAEKMFNNLVKAVVDTEKNLMVVDAALHADEESFLLDECESKQENLWGINLFPDAFGTDGFVVFDSMINLRPAQGNRSRGVDDPQIQKKIREVVSRLVKK